MTGLLSAALLSVAVVREVTLTPENTASPIKVECPVGESTRLVFPERLSRVTASAGAKTAMGITVESYRPQGVMTARPPSPGGPARLEIAGPTMRLVLELRSVERGPAAEIRFVVPAAMLPAVGKGSVPAGAPVPGQDQGTPPTSPGAVDPQAAKESPGPSANSPLESPNSSAEANRQFMTPTGAHNGSGEAQPDVTGREQASRDSNGPPANPAASSASPPDELDADLGDLLSAKPERIGRREGLPGQKPVVLVDALKGEAWLYLRFLVENGSDERVASITIGEQALDVLVEAPQDKALRIVVRVPPSAITRKTRVTLKLVSGAEYRFGLSSGTLTAFLKGLFR